MRATWGSLGLGFAVAVAPRGRPLDEQCTRAQAGGVRPEALGSVALGGRGEASKGLLGVKSPRPLGIPPEAVAKLVLAGSSSIRCSLTRANQNCKPVSM